MCFFVVCRGEAAVADEDVAQFLHQSSDTRHGEQVEFPDVTSEVRSTEAIPGLVPETGTLCLLWHFCE